jgi:hypothetical protein
MPVERTFFPEMEEPTRGASGGVPAGGSAGVPRALEGGKRSIHP